VYPYIGETSFIASPGMAGIVGNIYTGLEDFEEQGFLLHIIRKDDLFVDVGANVGGYTLLAAGICHAQVIAIEPIPAAIERLTLNIRLNNLAEKVKIIRAGCSSTREVLKFTNDLDVLNRVVAPNENSASGKTLDVKALPLDEILSGLKPVLLKIDVEGYELEVIRGAKETLQKPSLLAVIVELHGHENRYGFDYRDVHDFLTANGFSPCTYDPFTRSLSLQNDYNHYKFNTLYIRNHAIIRKRIQQGKSVVVLGQTF
jgi:FkbM family methyltransferase